MRPTTQDHSVLFDTPGPRAKRLFNLLNVIGVTIIVAVVAWVLVVLRDKGQLDADMWAIVLQKESWTAYFLPGIKNTLVAAVVSIVGAFAFGLVFGVGRLARNFIVRTIAGGVVEFFRAVPVLLMMIFLWSAIGMTNLPNPAFLAVVIALILYNGSVCADLVRSGVVNLPLGQHEAAEALGLTRTQSLIHVLLPQALLSMLPALIAQLVVALKDSALGYMISYSELLRQARLLGTPFNTLQTLTVAAIIFIVLNYSLGKLGEKLAARMRGRTSRLDDDFAEEIPMNVSAISMERMLESVDSDGYNEPKRRHEPPRWPDVV